MQRIRIYFPAMLAVLSIALAGYGVFQNILAHPWSDPSNQMVETWDGKIQVLREFLPSDVTRVGYLDKSMITNQPETFDGEEFFLMQYSMAPVTLDRGINQTWIVGNFDKHTDFLPWLDENLGNYEVQPFGYSLYLIHKLDE